MTYALAPASAALLVGIAKKGENNASVNEKDDKNLQPILKIAFISPVQN